MQRTLKIGSAEAVVDTMGGELISYMNHGREYVWTGDKAYWNGHAPVLFPFVSAIRNNEVSFQDERYTIASKHGFARKSEFQLEECTDSKAVFKLKANDTTMKMYPYDFTLSAAKINKRLQGTEFAIDYSDYDVDALIAQEESTVLLSGALERTARYC